MFTKLLYHNVLLPHFSACSVAKRLCCKTSGVHDEKADGEPKADGNQMIVWYTGRANLRPAKVEEYRKSLVAELKFETRIASSNGEVAFSKGVVLGVYDTDGKYELTPAAAEVDAKSNGKIMKHLNELPGRLKLGNAILLTDVVPEYSVTALASFGPKDAGYNDMEALDETRENVRWGVGAGVKALDGRARDVVVEPGPAPDAAAEAAHLAAWRFQKYKAVEDRVPEMSVHMLGEGGEEKSAGGWGAGVVRARAQNWARFLSDVPANKMTPIDVAQEALDVLCPLGVRVEVRERAWAEAQRMAAFLAVARGSREPPLLLECAYHGADSPPVLLAAKGVTFDSGGLCLKKPESMVENRGSMAGAAVVLAALRGLAELKVPVNVRAVIPLCENMVGGQCMKVGDVVRTLNGLNVEIECTDMEGRLMLADALVYGQATHRPALVVDVATLTRGVSLATGGGACGCFTNSAAAWRQVRAAGAASGDRAWRLPLWRYYDRQLTNNPSVDLRNQGSGKAAPCLGAAFLRNFVCGPWVHLDITGVGKLSHGAAPPYLRARRMSGRPARTLLHLLQAPPPLPQEDHTQP